VNDYPKKVQFATHAIEKSYQAAASSKEKYTAFGKTITKRKIRHLPESRDFCAMHDPCCFENAPHSGIASFFLSDGDWAIPEWRNGTATPSLVNAKVKNASDDLFSFRIKRAGISLRARVCQSERPSKHCDKTSNTIQEE
jgi:hypothetical protein